MWFTFESSTLYIWVTSQWGVILYICFKFEKKVLWTNHAHFWIRKKISFCDLLVNIVKRKKEQKFLDQFLDHIICYCEHVRSWFFVCFIWKQNKMSIKCPRFQLNQPTQISSNERLFCSNCATEKCTIFLLKHFMVLVELL